VLNDFEIPETLPAPAQAVLRGVAYFRAAGRNPPARWFETLRDLPQDGGVADLKELMG
jgi:acetoin utilization protein AcuC